MEYKLYTKIEPGTAWYDEVCRLNDLIFGAGSAAQIEKELGWRREILIAAAFDGERLAGFKAGYEDRNSRFYSWLGGVETDARGRGIASELMRLQHDWCREEGYEVVRTQTKNKWRSMLILNLRHGFDIIGTYTDGKGEAKIILEKKLLDNKKNDHH